MSTSSASTPSARRWPSAPSTTRTASRTRSPWRSASTATTSRRARSVSSSSALRREPSDAGERHTRGESACCVRGGVVEHFVEEVRRDDAGAVRRIERVERREHDHAVAVAERGLDDRQAVLRRRIGSCADQRRAPRRLRRGRARPRGEGRPSRRAAATAAVALPAVRGSSSAATTRRTTSCSAPSSGIDGVERRRAHRRVGVVEEARRACFGSAADDPARAERGRRRAPVGGIGRARELGGERSRLRSRPEHRRRRRAGRGRAHAPRDPRARDASPERFGGSRRRDAGQQVEAEAHVTGIVGPEQRLQRGVVLGEVVRAATSERRLISSASARVYDRYIAAPLAVQITLRTTAKTITAPIPRPTRFMSEQHGARGADRDGNADAFHDRLHGKTVPDRDHLERGVDGRAGGAVGQHDVGEAGHGREHEEAVRGGARPGHHDGHHDEQRGDDGGVEDEPEPQAEATHQRAGEESEEEDVREVEERRVPGQEAGEVVSAVVRMRAVEEEVVDQPRPHRRKHLVDEEEENEARREQRSCRGPGRLVRRSRPEPSGLPGTSAPSRAGGRETRAAQPSRRAAGARSIPAGRGAGSRGGRRGGTRPRTRRRPAESAPSSAGRPGAGPPVRR